MTRFSIQATSSQEDTATGIATFGFVRNIAECLAVLLGGVVFNNGMKTRGSQLEDVGLPLSIIQALTGGEAAAHVTIITSILDQIQRLAVRAAFAWSLRNLFILTTSLSACTVIAGVFIAQMHLSTNHVERKTGLRQEAQ